MYKIIATLAAATMLYTSCTTSNAQAKKEKHSDGSAQTDQTDPPRGNQPNKVDVPSENTIQVALLLDVSSSMDGLINQAKSEMWSVVNEIGKATKNGKDVNLQIALYDYGKSSHDPAQNYVRKLLDFTGDLDTLSEVLFSLNTNGGDEYCGAVIKKSVEELQWQNNNNYDVIFIAGNEPFTQGKVKYEMACDMAKQKNIFVNTIHCGEEKTGIETKWKDGARLGGGEYFYINSNSVEKFVPSPYDEEIERLNNELNNTYWGYGKTGKVYKMNQSVQDNNNSSLNKKGFYDRASAKASNKAYEKNSVKWDITSRAKEDKNYLDSAREEKSPQQLQGKSVEQKKEIVLQNSTKRDSVAKELEKFTALRNNYLAEKRKSDADANAKKDNSLGRAMAEAIHKQAGMKGFVWKD
jgi:von Willebrand factor type A domain